jgi:hypothetical protein
LRLDEAGQSVATLYFVAGLEPIEYPGVGVGQVAYRLHAKSPGGLVEEDSPATEFFRLGGVSGWDDQ